MHKNKEASRFHDQSTCWEGNDQWLNNDLTKVHHNETLPKFRDSQYESTPLFRDVTRFRKKFNSAVLKC
jgi:hypothetical protein